MANFIPLSGWPQIKDLPDLRKRLERIEKIEAWKADTSYIEETGAEIEIDNCLGVPANQLSLTFAAQQDLHGYSKPWAGGAGKNKLGVLLSAIKSANTAGTWSDNVYTYNDVTVTIDTDDSGYMSGITLDGTSSARFDFIVMPNTSVNFEGYLFNGNTSGSDNTYRMYMWDATTNSQGCPNQNTGDVTVTAADGDTVRILLGISANISMNNVVIKPMVRLSSVSDATFEPYSNICPITGKSSVSLTDTDGTETATKTVSLGSTVYGGTVDFMEGSGESEYNSYTFDGTNYTPVDHSSGKIYMQFVNASTFKTSGVPYSNAYEGVDGTSVTAVAGQCYVGGYGVYIVPTDAIPNAAALTAYATANNLQFVMPLATPAELTLTADPLTMYRGTNTLSTSDGSIYIKALTGRAF